MYEKFSSVFQGINILGLLLALPLLVATAMSFDHASDPPHWAHLAFVFGTMAFPSLALFGTLLKQQRYLGLIGLTLAALGWSLFAVVCHGEFRCNP